GPGDVGCVIAQRENIKDTRVGDTITDGERPAHQPLPGYGTAVPMAFCGLYPVRSEQNPDLPDARERLPLNDVSLDFEPEGATALGFGFRCGFLGLLHMEIIQERLEREFGLSLITTAPSVVYRVTRTDGSVQLIDNPSKFPEPAVIRQVEEPYVRASI